MSTMAKVVNGNVPRPEAERAERDRAAAARGDGRDRLPVPAERGVARTDMPNLTRRLDTIQRGPDLARGTYLDIFV